MERLLAGTFLFAAIIQAQLLFVGAFQISLQTDWALLGNYFRQEVVRAYQGVTQPAAPPPAAATPGTAQTRSALFIDSAAEDDAVKPKP